MRMCMRMCVSVCVNPLCVFGGGGGGVTSPSSLSSHIVVVAFAANCRHINKSFSFHSIQVKFIK